MKLFSKMQGSAILPLATLLAVGSSSAYAQVTFTHPTRSLLTVSDTPAATLLVPYFEVDLSNPNGRNTIFAITNSGEIDPAYDIMGNPIGADQNGPTAILTHVTIWSDLGVPVLNFMIYLTGFDAQTVNMRNILSGMLPQTASAGQDPTDAISPKGIISQDINFASCTQPVTHDIHHLPPTPLSAAQLTDLQNSLTGLASALNGGQCAAQAIGDHVARGYVTIDLVNSCTSLNPGDPGPPHISRPGEPGLPRIRTRLPGRCST